MKNLFNIMIILIFALGCIACGKKKPQDLEEYMKMLKQSAPVTATKDLKGIITLPQVATYTNKSLRSPFEEKDKNTEAKKSQITTPLMGYPVSLLRFVGIVKRDDFTYAYIQAPDNIVYQVKEGDPIGDRSGKVLSLENDQLTLSEDDDTEEGNISKKRIVTLQLKEGP